VTVAVTPKDAAKIGWTMAAGGQITMALRRPDDDKTVKSADTQVSSLGSSGDKDGDPDQNTETVLVALKEIEKGKDLKGADLKEFFKEQRVPEGMFADDVFVKNMRDPSLPEAKVRETIKPGTPVMRILFSGAEESKSVPGKVEDVAPKSAEKFVQRIYNGSRDPITTVYEGNGQTWITDRRDAPSAPSPMPAPSKEPSDKDAPKSGSEGK